MTHDADIAVRLRALADEFDAHSDRLYDEALGVADRDAAVVLRSKSGTYAANAERIRDLLDEYRIPPATSRRTTPEEQV